MDENSDVMNFDQVEKREKKLQLNSDLQKDMADIGKDATDSLKKSSGPYSKDRHWENR